MVALQSKVRLHLMASRLVKITLKLSKKIYNGRIQMTALTYLMKFIRIILSLQSAVQWQSMIGISYLQIIQQSIQN